MPSRTGTCSDCGAAIDATGKRGRIPARCPKCTQDRKVAANTERYRAWAATKPERPARAPRPVRHRYLTCTECGDEFRVQVRRGGLPKTCEDCREARRYRLAREIVRPPEVRLAQRLRRYGLTVEQWQQMMDEQDGRCALCRRPPAAEEGRFSLLEVDHDHETGRVRSLLCGTCNTGLGKLQDSPALLRKAADYVERHRALGPR